MNCRQLPKRIHISVSTKKKDSCFLLKNKEIVFVKEKRDDKKYVCDVLKDQTWKVSMKVHATPNC